MATYYISFAANKGFLGVTVVDAEDPEGAIVEASRLGLNPGGEAAIWELPPNNEEAVKYKNRLVSREELIANGSVGSRDLSHKVHQAIMSLAYEVCEECNPVVRN